jgi:hypothetical protein
VAGYHHQPAQLADNSRLLVTLVFVADTVCCQAGCGFNLTAASQKLEEGRIDELGIDTPLIDRTRTALPELMDSARGLF